MRPIQSLALSTIGFAAARALAVMGPSRSPGQRKGYRIINRLNRSRRWPAARSYAEARAKSPFPNRPVR